MFGERLQVLHDGCEMELVARASETPQAHAFEAMMGFQMRKPHLDPLPLIAGPRELGCAHDGPSDVARFFIHGAGHLAPGHVWTAFRL